jgi:hypothetical protein
VNSAWDETTYLWCERRSVLKLLSSREWNVNENPAVMNRSGIGTEIAELLDSKVPPFLKGNNDKYGSAIYTLI